jgi:hypothetical protein
MTALWPIQRKWIVTRRNNGEEEVLTNELRRYRVCVLLGSAGLGKTYEMRRLARDDGQSELDVRGPVRLADLGTTPESLERKLAEIAAGATHRTAISLDALDEVMVPVQTAGKILAAWIRDTLKGIGPVLRISCRSAVWPSKIEAAIREVYGEEESRVAHLQPMTEDDVTRAANCYGLDVQAFVAGIERSDATTLSRQPLCLEMLLRLYEKQGNLPAGRQDLFRKGVELLASERDERREDNTDIDIELVELLDAAERLACLCLLSGRDTIDVRNTAHPASLGLLEIGGLPGGRRPLDAKLLQAVGRSGLCDGVGQLRFRFWHRQFAEYLAGRRISTLPLHQARSLLSCGVGWRAGVAGPLRETAAFAAVESEEIAEWVAESDPEIIGLSDVANCQLRRHAVFGFLDKFRRHELTDAQVLGDGLPLAGFQYPGVETDLRPVLRERGGRVNDVLECAVEMIASWKLSSMNDDLAELVLDPEAPMEARKAAGYSLLQMGTTEARHRLKPLILGDPNDSLFILKGIALRCNWPENLTLQELLSALTPDADDHYFGAYQAFLHTLDNEHFDAKDDPLAGLAWARQYACDSDHTSTSRIAKRIAIAAVDALDRPGVAESLASLMLEAAQSYSGSPLSPPEPRSWDTSVVEERSAMLANRPAERRKLLTALAAHATEDSELHWAAHRASGLLALEDFRWLLQQATDATLPLGQRENFADLARMIPWDDSVEGVEAWFSLRTTEPVASRFPQALLTVLNSPEAAAAKKAFAAMNAVRRPSRRRRLRLLPKKRVKRALELCETTDPRYFVSLCNQLTLENDSTGYGFERFVTKTPGWGAADAEMRARIVEVAKRLLETETEEPQRIRSEPLNSIPLGYMNAVWLTMECDRGWLDGLPHAWWQRWTWYILRELRPHFENEPEERKTELLKMLQAHVNSEMMTSLEALAGATDMHSVQTLKALLDELGSIDNPELDHRLCGLLARGCVSDESVTAVADFVLARNGPGAITACVTRFEPKAAGESERDAIGAAVALLLQRTPECWEQALGFLERRPDLARRVLGAFASDERHDVRSEKRIAEPKGPNATLVGRLAAILLEIFPLEQFRERRGAYAPGPDDCAVELRDRTISSLGDQRELEAVEALRRLEQRFGGRYAWLRRPRARAERAYRLANWAPVSPAKVAQVLAAHEKRLIRSGSDAVDGIVTAIEQYVDRLHRSSSDDLEDFWNLPKTARPSPKEEERVSSKLCSAIRGYFQDYAICADREVQISRRKLAAHEGGSPGSETDVLYRAAAAIVAEGGDIAIPIEVKLAHNPESLTALRDQLVNRYMSELGTNHGIFVVAWMGMPRPPAKYKPRWSDITEARNELNRQAAEVMSPGEELDVRAVVIDLSLPTTPSKRKQGTAKRLTGGTKAPTGKAKGQRKASKTRKIANLEKQHPKSLPVKKARRRKTPPKNR